MDTYNSDVIELSIVLATLNEIENVPQLVKEAEEVLFGLSIRYQFLFVDDNSTDGTRDFIKEYCRSNHLSKYIFNQRKRSTLIARYQGIKEADGKYIIIMDADLQHPPKYLPEIYRGLAAGNDIVLASRYLLKNGTGNRLASRGVISRVAAFLASLLMRTSRTVTDPLSCYIGFKSSLKIDINEKWKGYEIGIFIRASNPYACIKEIPYVFAERGKGKSKVTSNISFITGYLKELILAKRTELNNLKKHQKFLYCS